MVKDLRTRRVSARVTETLYQKVKKIADKRKWSVSDAVEVALQKLVDI